MNNIFEVLNFGYYGLLALAIAVWGGFKVYSLKHTIKNKWIAQIPELAAAFVHKAETTNNDGRAKMDNVLTGVCNFLRQRGVNITPELELAIEAFAEKELAQTINANKANKEKEATK